MSIIRHGSLPISPWPNGAGRKADIARAPHWLVAFAWLERDAPFSDYTGWDRTITLLDGAGFSLHFADGEVLFVLEPHVPRTFDGGRAVRCELIAGVCRVANVMTERAVASHQVTVGGARVASAGETVWTIALERSGEMDRWDAVAGAPSGDGMFLFASIHQRERQG